METVIEQAKESTLAGCLLERKMILELLAIDPESAMAERLGRAAREVAEQVAGNAGRVWASIGVDYASCPVNCRFCSFGEKWGLVQDARYWNEEQIIKTAKLFLHGGARWITLRTTEYYSTEALARLARRVRDAVPGRYGIVANTGELDAKTSDTLLNATIGIAYHSLRLREGVDTGIRTASRLQTLASIQTSPLELAYLVEPIGEEHTNEEIADVLLTAMKYGASLTGAMARVPVAGTPLGELPIVSERRLAQITAVTRLVAGRQAPNICSHPASKLAMEWGANVVVVEAGAIPREAVHCGMAWRGFDMEQATLWLQQAGYILERGLEA